MKFIGLFLCALLTSCATYQMYIDCKYRIQGECIVKGKPEKIIWYVNEYKLRKDTLIINYQEQEWKIIPPYTIICRESNKMGY